MNRLPHINGQPEAHQPSNRWQLNLVAGLGHICLFVKTTGPDFVNLGKNWLVRRKILNSTAEEIWLLA